MAQMLTKHRNDDVDVLADIDVPKKYYERITTGVLVLDEIFGGQLIPGLPPFVSMLFTGMPGAGKTTMVLQIADLVQKQSQVSVLYNVNEQNRYIVKMVADRMNLGGNFAISQFGDVNKLMEYCKANGVQVLIQDSIQTLQDGDLSGQKLLQTVGQKLTDFADENNILVIMVGHITKGGDFAGPMKLKHIVDMHAHLSYNKDTGNRIFQLKKNRFGPAMMPYEFFLGADGIDFRVIEDPLENTKRAKSSQKKEAVIEKAKEMLFAGKKLSGYTCLEDTDFIKWAEDEGYEVSGGYWRGILERVKGELEREGHTIGTCSIKRREHIFLED